MQLNFTKIFLPLIFCYFLAEAKAQSFANQNSGFLTLGSGSIAVADFDKDGDADFALQGFSGVFKDTMALFENVNGTFVPISGPFHSVSSGSLDWGDMDNDGDLDLLQCGIGKFDPETNIYRNDGNKKFTRLTPVKGFMGCARWFRMDNDNLPDIIMAGPDTTYLSNLEVWKNKGNGNFELVSNNLPKYLSFPSIAPRDLDADGDDEIFVTGVFNGSSNYSQILKNNGSAQFSVLQKLYPLYTGEGQWGDLNNDGKMDLVYNGVDSVTGNGRSLIYINQGSNVFAMLPDSLPGTGEPGSVDLGDVDVDGDLDILLSGTYLIRNDGKNKFTNVTITPEVLYSYPTRFIDYDKDQDLDLLCVQSYPGENASTIYKNVSTPMSTLNISRVGEVIVFPNPANDEIHFLNGCGRPVKITLFNVAGVKVLEKILSDMESNVKIDGYPNGIYFYEICIDSKHKKSGKIIKQ